MVFGAARDDLRYRPVSLSESTQELKTILKYRLRALFSFDDSGANASRSIRYDS